MTCFFSITKSEFCNLADDNTLYSSNTDLDQVFDNLCYRLMCWIGLSLDSLKANPDKLQFIVLGANKNKSFSVNVKGINYFMTETVIR